MTGVRLNQFAAASAAAPARQRSIAIDAHTHAGVPASRTTWGRARARGLLPWHGTAGVLAGGTRRSRETMRMTPWRTVGMMTAALVATGGGARADVTGSYDGQLAAKKVAQPIVAAGVFSVSGKTVTGTIAIGGDAAGAGAYIVNGRATPKRLNVKGALGGVTLVWRAKISGDTLQGRARIKGAGAKLVGTLSLAHNPPLADGSTCDAVFNQNQTFFTQQVLDTSLVACTACHVPGGQAEATRFRVDINDALATARSVAPLVDSANPDASRIIEKPLALVPHGGGVRITPGSSEDVNLRQWVGMIAAAACN